MKRLFSLVVAVILLTASICSALPKATAYPNVLRLQTAHLIGGEHGYLYYSGSDTLAPAAFVDTLGYDTLGSHWLQIGPILSDASTLPVLSRSDSLFLAGGRNWWLWVQIDTTTFHHGVDTGYGGAVGHTDADSVGLTKISFRVSLTWADTVVANAAWLADTTNLAVLSGNYSNPMYRTWLYEVPKTVVATAGVIKRWNVYNLRVPACALVQVRFRSSDTIKECTKIKWYLVGAY